MCPCSHIYRNITFCDSDCLNIECERYFGYHDQARSEEMGLAVTLNDFSNYCDEYIEDKGEAVQISPGLLK
jgi:hypothetical protein